jgi:hypothetical protein
MTRKEANNPGQVKVSRYKQNRLSTESKKIKSLRALRGLLFQIATIDW